MKNIFYLLLGVCLIFLTSLTTASVMTIKPTAPKYVVVKSFNDADFGDIQSKYIERMLKKGWILKSQSLAGKQYTIYGIVVFEKY